MTVGPAGVGEPEIERIFRQEYGRAVSVLIRAFGDIDLAEDGVQDAFTVASQRWPEDGLPPSPAGWIITTARNRIVDRLRREASRQTARPRRPRSSRRPTRTRRSSPCRTTASA